MLYPNTTAIQQPMDTGIIMTAKSRFKKFYYEKLLQFNLEGEYCRADPKVEFMKHCTLLDCIVGGCNNERAQKWDVITNG